MKETLSALLGVRAAAYALAALLAVLTAFQIALAFGAPWGAYAMGGAFPGVYPPPMRVAALVQALIYAAVVAIAWTRAGLILPRLRRWSHGLMWGVAALFALSAAMNALSPSPGERMLWTPVALVLFFASVRIALPTKHSA